MKCEGLLKVTLMDFKFWGILFSSSVVTADFFSISFAFAVGVSTFNFGTLVRYKIPLLPFFLVALVLIRHHSKSARKLDELETTE